MYKQEFETDSKNAARASSRSDPVNKISLLETHLRTSERRMWDKRREGRDQRGGERLRV